MRGRSIAITTKGDLIRRDTPLLLEIAQNNTLSINFSIATLDLRLARALEPGAPRPDLRLAAVESLSRAGLATGVFASPVLPGLTDGRRLEAVAQAASACGARRFGAQMLFLKPAAARVFLPWLEREFPALAPAYRAQFARAAYLRGETVYASPNRPPTPRRYHLDAHRLAPTPQQLVLFPRKMIESRLS